MNTKPDWPDGAMSQVSPLGCARVRYVSWADRWQMSIEASSYFELQQPTSAQVEILRAYGWTYRGPGQAYIEVTEDQAKTLYDSGWRFVEHQPRWVSGSPVRAFQGHSDEVQTTKEQP